MQDQDKTKAQLVEELQQLREKVGRLEDSENKFRGLAESTTAHITIMQDDQYAYANQAFLDYNGLDLDDLEVTTPAELMMGVMTPETIKAAEPAWQAAVDSGEKHFHFEYQDLEGNWFQTHVTMMELDGRPAFMAMDIDITENKRAHEAMAESEKKFRALAESTTAQILITQDDRFIYANKAALDHKGLSWDELSGCSPNDLLVGDEEITEACAAFAEEQLELGGGKFRTVYSEPDEAGGERWFEAHVSTLDVDGEQAFISTAFDITELKRAQNEMYRADKMAALGQLVAGVAHEINNPNNFIYFNLPILKKYIEAIRPLLERHLEEEPDLKILNMPYDFFLQDVFKLLENMEHGSMRITSIVSDLKSYVRNDEDQVLKPEQVGQALERVMTLVGKQVRKMVKRFDVEISDGLPPIQMNAGKIEQVLINLLINAGQAADKEESWVKVSARPAPGVEGWVELLVEDNGAGIPEASLQQIFEPFYTSKGRDQGTGLGLSISHRIIEEHGGSISVESKLGEGTCFTVHLPVAGDV